MKICPVCQAKAFDDAEVCYGCLHHFKDSLSESEKSTVLPPVPLTASPQGPNQQISEIAQQRFTGGQHATRAPQTALAPEFCIRLVPTSKENGEVAWHCNVELCK